MFCSSVRVGLASACTRVWPVHNLLTKHFLNLSRLDSYCNHSLGLPQILFRHGTRALFTRIRRLVLMAICRFQCPGNLLLERNLSKGLKDFAQDEVVRTIVLVSSLLSFCLWRILQKNIPMTNISWFFEGRGGAAGAPGLLATCQRDWKTLHRMK